VRRASRQMRRPPPNALGGLVINELPPPCAYVFPKFYPPNVRKHICPSSVSLWGPPLHQGSSVPAHPHPHLLHPPYNLPRAHPLPTGPKKYFCFVVLVAVERGARRPRSIPNAHADPTCLAPSGPAAPCAPSPNRRANLRRTFIPQPSLAASTTPQAPNVTVPTVIVVIIVTVRSPLSSSSSCL
jgi:hypothetical protein